MIKTETLRNFIANNLETPPCYGNLKRECQCPILKECLEETVSRDSKRGD